MFLDAFGCLLLLTKINEQIFSNFFDMSGGPIYN